MRSRLLKRIKRRSGLSGVALAIVTRHIALGDWGTTHLSLGLLDAQTGFITERLTGPGIGRLNGERPDEVVMHLIKPWWTELAINDLILCGMVGSNKGWVEVPYLACPTDLIDLSNHTNRFKHEGLSVQIVPGLSCRNALGFYDVMRGEETQLLGWHSQTRSEGINDAVICLPGTHTKWASLQDGLLSGFMTSVPGELYAALKAHSVLISKQTSTELFDEAAFRSGVRDSLAQPGSILSLLFSVRSQTLEGRFSDSQAADYLSGLIIGLDVATARRHFVSALSSLVHVIGSKTMLERYTIAMAMCDLKTICYTGSDMAFKGLTEIMLKQTL